MRVSVVFTGVVVIVICTFTTTRGGLPHQHTPHFPDKRQAEYAASLRSYEVITPVRVNQEGEYLSHHLHQTHAHNRAKRSAFTEDAHHLHYVVTLDGKEHQVSLRPNRQFVAPHAVVERRRGGGGTISNLSSSLQVVGTLPSCHYLGYVANHTTSKVAISTCQGLTGYVRTDDDEYLIEPVRNHVRPSPDHPQPHLVYKRSALPFSDAHTCSTSDAYRDGIRSRARWENSQGHSRRKRSLSSYGDEEEETKRNSSRRRRRRKRSVSLERNVEVTVVADKKMVDYYPNEDITTYILTVMNMVSSVYHDASIGNAVNIYVVRIMLLEDDKYQEELDISHNADNTLRSFCQWQQMINPGNETHLYHHDVAVLITRFNICSKMTDRCSTLGVAEIAGMCQPLRSCNVNEDTGLQIAYTIAHELGHNFGMNHDGPQNGCESQYGVSQHVMSPHLTSEPIPVTWSNCSRKEITHFLDRDWGACLEDEPLQVEFNFPELPPGAMYDADHQCRLSFGSDATHCSGIEGIERVCQTLWCHLNNRCITRMEPAAEGTQCGKHKWCVMGRCVMMGERPAAIHGNWGSWSKWSPCSRTCGAGTSSAQRHCDNPAPANGGRYCTGDRKRYRICNTQECPENGVSFRAVQCSQFDNQPYKGTNHTWGPVMFDHASCQLDCKPDNEFYSVKLQDTVVDGTPCKPGTRDMCIHGMCKRVACDWTIEGSAQQDRCGLCHGDGTQCITTRGVFNVTRGSGYVPVVTFPQDARNVRVTEIDDAANYLAVSDNETDRYFLNGNWIIQWSGEYHADGTMIYYSREGETEELFLPGPLKQSLTLQLLFQTENPGLEWEYTLPHENVTYTPEFTWEHSDWSVCTVTCGGGKQVSKVQCMEKEAGLVEDKYCSNQTRPDDLSRVCNSHACPAWWWSGPWQPCSLTCGDEGTRRRTVICVRSFGPTEQMALLDSDCGRNLKPHEIEMCGILPSCPEFLEWSAGPWSQTCTPDPCDFEEREVSCVAQDAKCDPLTRPPDRRQCGNITCGHWDVGEWSKCSAPCGEGAQFRRVSCIEGLACREKDEPKSVQECLGECSEEETVPEVEMESINLPMPPTPMSTILTSTASLTSAVPTFTSIEGESTTHNSLQTESASTTSSTPKENTIAPVPSVGTTTSVPAPTVGGTTSAPAPTVGATTSAPTPNVGTTTSAPAPNVATTTIASVPTVEKTTIAPEISVGTTTISSVPSVGTTTPVVTSTLKTDADVELTEDSSPTILIPAANESTLLLNTTTVMPTEPTSEVPGSTELDAEIMMSEPPITPTTLASNSDFLSENKTQLELENEDNIIERTEVNQEDFVKEDEDFNSTDISNDYIADDPSAALTDAVNETELHAANQTEEENTDEENLNFQNTSNILPKDEMFSETINEIDTDSMPVKLEDPELVSDDDTQLESAINSKVISDEQVAETHEIPQVKHLEERRPEGIIEDKINMEDFEVIEIIEVPAEGKRKKDKKKVLIHTGEEAVNVLHDIAEEQAAKRISATPVPEILEPKYMWIVGEWTECSVECGGGIQGRTVECFEVIDGSPVDPELCQGEKPPNFQSCNDAECGEWEVGEWEECSAECDVGERQRSVECPADKLCPSHSQPIEVEACNLGPCVKWVEGPWSLCTRSCGAGYQIRHVKCVDVRTQKAARTCPREIKPKHKMACHNQRCPKRQRGQQRRCRDLMDSKLCRRLKHLCSTNFFRIKCCTTCFKRRFLAKVTGRT